MSLRESIARPASALAWWKAKASRVSSRILVSADSIRLFVSRCSRVAFDLRAVFDHAGDDFAERGQPGTSCPRQPSV